MRELQLTTIVDTGRWHNRDGQYNNKHHIDILWNGSNEKAKKNAEKNVIKSLRCGREPYTPYEIEKTAKDRQIISERTWAVNNIVRLFGGIIEPIDDNRIHLLKPGSLERDSGGNKKNAFCDDLSFCVSVDRHPSDIITAVNITHEALHLESPKIFELIKEEILPSRLGLKFVDSKDEVRLAETDEALTGELNYQLFKKNIERNPLYKKELEEVKKIKPWINEVKEKGILGEIILLKNINLEDIYTVVGAKEILEILESRKSKGYKIAYMADVIENPGENRGLATFERSQEWTDFSNLSYRLITESKGEIRTRWEVIDMFARVKFAPNEKFFKELEFLKVKIDSILGEGAFEKIK